MTPDEAENEQLTAALEAVNVAMAASAVQMREANGAEQAPSEVLNLVMLMGCGQNVLQSEEIVKLGRLGLVQLITGIVEPFRQSVYEAAAARGLEPVEWMGEWRRRHEAGGDTPSGRA